MRREGKEGRRVLPQKEERKGSPEGERGSHERRSGGRRDADGRVEGRKGGRKAVRGG